ncbi:MAG TPA: tetratricopeptide repeat protein [Gemmatimonadaceae bacterium]
MSDTSQAPVSELLADGIRYERNGVVQRARECFEAVTERADSHPAAAAEAWWHLANVHRLHSRWEDALAAANRGAALAREHGWRDIEANALNIEGAVWWARGEYGQARALFTRILDLAMTPATRAKALQNLGSLAAEARDFDEAERLFTESRDAYRAADDQRGEAVSLLNIGRLQMDRGELASARETLEAALNEARQAGDLEMLAGAQLNLGIALAALGLSSEAEDRITTAYGQFTIADVPSQRVRCLMQLAVIASERHETAAARVCLEHAFTVAESANLPVERRLVEEQLSAL